MDISINMNDIIQSTIILIIIIYGTKLTNYYYNFYHIYNYLDYEQKLGYFKYNYLVNFISTSVFIKKIIVYYFLIPIIKLNYLFISIFITLLYSLCYSEFNKILSEQQKKKYKNKKNLEIILSETLNDINNSSNLNNTNTTNDINQINNENPINDIYTQNDKQNEVEQKNYNFDSDIKISKNEIYNVDKIGVDYDNGILNIIEFISDTNFKNTYIQTDKNNILESISISKSKSKSKSESKEQELDNKNEISNNNQMNNSNFKLNLLDEIDLLKINKETHNKYNYTNDTNNTNDINNINNTNDTNNTNYTDDINNTNIIDDDDLDNYINNNNTVSVIKNNNNKNDYNIDNDINKYLIVDKEIKNDNLLISQNEELNETINLDEIDFGMKIENLNINSVKNNSVIKTENNTKKKIIKIGKKK